MKPRANEQQLQDRLLEIVQEELGFSSFDETGEAIAILSTKMNVSNRKVYALLGALKDEGRLKIIPKGIGRLRRWVVIQPREQVQVPPMPEWPAQPRIASLEGRIDQDGQQGSQDQERASTGKFYGFGSFMR
jgi:hypothetical protein